MERQGGFEPPGQASTGRRPPLSLTRALPIGHSGTDTVLKVLIPAERYSTAPALGQAAQPCVAPPDSQSAGLACLFHLHECLDMETGCSATACVLAHRGGMREGPRKNPAALLQARFL